MKAIVSALFASVLLFLPGCAILPDTIKGNTGGLDVTADSVLAKDILAAKYNIDEAVKIGVLDANDPAPYCLDDIVKKAGLDGPAAASFQPHYEGIASAGAVAYIEARKLEKMKAAAKIDVSCEALIGRIVIDAARVVRKTAPIPGILR